MQQIYLDVTFFVVCLYYKIVRQYNKIKVMDQMGLKKEVLDEIRSNALLSGKVAFILGITTASLPRLLNSNHPKLTQAAILKILRDELRVTEDNKLLIKIPVEA